MSRIVQIVSIDINPVRICLFFPKNLEWTLVCKCLRTSSDPQGHLVPQSVSALIVEDDFCLVVGFVVSQYRYLL